MKRQNEFRLIIGKYYFGLQIGHRITVMYAQNNYELDILYLGVVGDVASGDQQLGNAPEEHRNVGQQKAVRQDDEQSVIVLGCRRANINIEYIQSNIVLVI